MTTSNQAISPKVLPAELNYAMANIDRIESAIHSLIGIVAKSNTLLEPHLQQLSQELVQSRRAVESAYLDARMAGYGTHSLTQHGAPLLVAAPEKTPTDANDVLKFLYSRIFDVDSAQAFKPHSGLSVVGTIKQMNAMIADESLPAIKAGLYTDGENSEVVLPLRYERNGLQQLTLVAYNPAQMQNLGLSHHVLVPSEGGWLTDVELKYFNADRFKMVVVTELATELQGQTLCANQYKEMVGQILAQADELLELHPDNLEVAQSINALNDGGLRIIAGGLEMVEAETPVGDAVRQELTELRRIKKSRIDENDGRLDMMPWTWRLAQLSTLHLELHTLKLKLTPCPGDDEVTADVAEEE